jgi:hypothetical protein
MMSLAARVAASEGRMNTAPVDKPVESAVEPYIDHNLTCGIPQQFSYLTCPTVSAAPPSSAERRRARNMAGRRCLPDRQAKEKRMRTRKRLLQIAVRGSASLSQRRARGSNPQPVSRHDISSVAASHSLTLQCQRRIRHLSPIEPNCRISVCYQMQIGSLTDFN